MCFFWEGRRKIQDNSCELLSYTLKREGDGMEGGRGVVFTNDSWKYVKGNCSAGYLRASYSVQAHEC